MRTQRDRDRVRRQQRRRKLLFLRRKLAQTTDRATRQRLIEKMRRISLTAPIPEE